MACFWLTTEFQVKDEHFQFKFALWDLYRFAFGLPRKHLVNSDKDEILRLSLGRSVEAT